MKFKMVMPKMGESIMEGTILRWLKSVGDKLDKDEIILEISTDKVDSEIPTPVEGVLSEIVAREGETIEVGRVIALIETEAGAEIAGAEMPETGNPESESLPAGSAAVAPVNSAEVTQATRFYSPVVLRIAREHGIGISRLEALPGSGLDGRVTKKDILGLIERGEQPAPTSPAPTQTVQTAGSTGPVEIIAMDHVRKSIAAHMIGSVQTSAHVSLYTEVDMNAIEKIRDRRKESFKQREGFGLTYMPFILEATVRALKEFPYLNASLSGEAIQLKKYYNIGIAVAVGQGLIVPNIFAADEKNLLGLARSINDLARRARNRKLKPEEVTNGTFSISNFGVYGTTIGFPIINQPQSAILGVGATKKRAVVIADAIAIRPVMYLSLTIDHRLIDGAMGSQFLERIRELLEGYEPALDI